MHKVGLLGLVSFFVGSAGLVAQATTWTSFQDRRGHAMARTAAGGVVMFGGERVTQPGQSLSDTHRLATGNQSWSRSSDAPVARVGHGMVGMLVNGLPKYFVFGGVTSGGQPSADTWQYDGSSWDPRGQGSSTPTARSAHGMVGGQLGGPFGTNAKLWVFGGWTGTSELSDLWEYQPQFDQWNLLGSAVGQPPGSWPQARSSHCLAFQEGANAGDERVYLFGGRTGTAAFSNDLWRFNPNTSTWTLLTPSNPPPARREAAMAYLPGQGGLVLFGGFSATSSAMGDTWVYDAVANAWTQRVTPVAPPGRAGHAVTVDASGNKLILMGGVALNGQPASGTWVWDSAAPGAPPGAWIEQLPVPSARSGAAFAFDSKPTRQKHVLFGGALSPSGTVSDETWELDGIDWSRKVLSAQPSARTDAGMVYHAARDRMVLFGGRNQAGTALGDTWDWNGATWALSSVTGAPPAAGGAQLVYDSSRSRIVMPVASGASMQTWVMSTTAWSQLSPVVSPSARTNHGAAYDTRRDQVVMFGGMSSNVRGSATYNNETWIFDGTAWVRRFPVSSPSPRGWCKLSYDESRSRVVLYGGADATNVWQDTWEWDGSNWIQELPAAAPSTSSLGFGNTSSYDGKRALTVTHGVLGTWDYGPVATADVTSYGVGCTTSANATLNLKQLGWSRLWLGDRLELDIEGAPSFSLGLMLWGLSDSTFGPGVPLPLDLRLIGFSTGPCFLSTSADITTEAVFPPTTRYTSFAMPVDPFLLGLELYLQMAYFDAPANPSNPPVVTSNALKMKLGQKASIVATAFEPNPALNMVRIEAGTFTMGSTTGQLRELPPHPVTITQPFWIGRYEVTQAEFSAVMQSNPSLHQGASFPDAPSRPVERVSMAQAMDYCASLTASEGAAGRLPAGYIYRLPTEAEWEYCCRAGSVGEFAFGASLPSSLANIAGSIGQTRVVGQYPANAWGLHDMHGNVMEWCLDFWDASSGYGSGAVADPLVRGGMYGVYRGGNYTQAAVFATSTYRDGSFVGRQSEQRGFRIVLGSAVIGSASVFYPPLDYDMVAIPNGVFSMGSALPTGTSPYWNQLANQPVRAVTITRPFWIGRYEVTQEHYQLIVGSNPSTFVAGQRPVESVTWNSALAFCSAINAAEAAAGRLPAGYQYRLPTEAEWEYCCRAGTTTEFSYGSTIACGQASFDFNYHTGSACGAASTSLVGSYAANDFGLHDMHGNVAEWCLDAWNGVSDYSGIRNSDPYSVTGSSRIIRGGRWVGNSAECRSAIRGGNGPSSASFGVGFRLVLGPVPVP